MEDLTNSNNIARSDIRLLNNLAVCLVVQFDTVHRFLANSANQSIFICQSIFVGPIDDFF